MLTTIETLVAEFANNLHWPSQKQKSLTSTIPFQATLQLMKGYSGGQINRYTDILLRFRQQGAIVN